MKMLFCLKKVNSKWGILKSPRQLVKIISLVILVKLNFFKNKIQKKEKNINNNDKPHPKSSNELLVCNLPLTLSLPKQCMQLEYMQGILSLSWNDCYVLYLIIY